VRADDGTLQPFQVADADAGVGERAEPGVDSVDGRVAFDRGGDHGPARLHDGGDARVEFGGGRAVRDVHHILNRERVAVDGHNSHGGQPAIPGIS
jgi:hypothetical protein